MAKPTNQPPHNDQVAFAVSTLIPGYLHMLVALSMVDVYLPLPQSGTEGNREYLAMGFRGRMTDARRAWAVPCLYESCMRGVSRTVPSLRTTS